MSEIDIIRFSEARAKALSEESETFSVGRLSEKLVHRTLKYYIDGDSSHHEIKHLGSVADVKNSDGIFEIQSRSFDKIEKKMTKYLADGKVTLVYPLISERYLTWINPENGEVIEGGIFDYFYRLIITDIKPPVFYRIKANAPLLLG